MTQDTRDKLIERLQAIVPRGQVLCRSPGLKVNPDGPEAAATLKADGQIIEGLLETLEEIAEASWAGSDAVARIQTFAAEALGKALDDGGEK
jgi:hypothetical protein